MNPQTPNSKLQTAGAACLPRDARIYIAGHHGLVGSAIWRALQRQGYTQLVGRRSRELDLTDPAAVEAFFAAEQPDYVVLAAAKVGGIVANNTYRAQFLHENLMIECNVLHAAWRHGVKKLLFLGSSCIYPKFAPQPLREEHLLTGPLEPTNEPYAIAKIAGIRLCDAYNRQYGTNFLAAMPTNMYGPGDNYHPENSHVLPALIRRMHLAKCLECEEWDALTGGYRHEMPSVAAPDREALRAWLDASGIHQRTMANGALETRLTCWGSGSPLREFLYSDDLAAACVFLLETASAADLAFEDETGTRQAHINIGSGSEISIRELAEMVRTIVGFRGRIEWDTTRPDGTPRKLMDSSRLRALGWTPQTNLEDGIARAYADFLQQSAVSRQPIARS